MQTGGKPPRADTAHPLPTGTHGPVCGGRGCPRPRAPRTGATHHVVRPRPGSPERAPEGRISATRKGPTHPPGDGRKHPCCAIQ
eukprot:1652339-Alexandrium_andersonii.AAC.1